MNSFQGLEPYVLKVHFWDVNDDDGNNTQNLTEPQMLEAVAQFNKNFNAFNIFFKYDGMSSINEEDFMDINYTWDETGEQFDFLDYQLENELYFPGTINIYSVNSISNGVAAYLQDETTEGKFSTIVIRNEYIDSSYRLSHEVGHFFRLDHTFQCGTFGDDCENVTRDPNAVDVNGNSIYDADIHGDKIIDTYASPQSYGTNNCEYIDNGAVDEVGQLYSDHPPQAKNFMSYAYGCQEEFTPGQVAVMRNKINFYDNHEYIRIIKNYPVSILYQPYKGEYYSAGPLPVDEDGHLNPPLFQYGFDYVFYDTSQADVWIQPTPWENTNFWYGGVVESFDVNHNSPIEHKNHRAFKILQIDGNFPRMCHNNYNRAPSGGTIIKFLDNVTNANVTISSQDSTSINHPNLIDNLDPGLYNIIENYDNGANQETMIFKENN